MLVEERQIKEGCYKGNEETGYHIKQARWSHWEWEEDFGSDGSSIHCKSNLDSKTMW